MKYIVNIHTHKQKLFENGYSFIGLNPQTHTLIFSNIFQKIQHLSNFHNTNTCQVKILFECQIYLQKNQFDLMQLKSDQAIPRTLNQPICRLTIVKLDSLVKVLIS